jgi:hypothetical protein
MSLFFIFSRVINVSFFYSRKDENMRQDLDAQLFSLKRNNGLNINWYECLLVSQYFMDSVDGWYIGEQAMKLCNARKACVIPIKLRQIDNWDATPFKDIQYLPKNGEPVDNRRFWLNKNAAFVDIAQGIREEVEKFEQEQKHRQFTMAEPATVFAPIYSFISQQAFPRISQFPNIFTRLVPIVVGVLALTALGYYNFSATNSAESLFNQGEQKSEQRDYLGAVKDYTQAIQLAPNNINAYLGRVKVYMYLKDYKAAIEDYTQIIRLAPDSAHTYMNRAEVLMELRDRQGAIKDAQKAAKLYEEQGATEDRKEALYLLQDL